MPGRLLRQRLGVDDGKARRLDKSRRVVMQHLSGITVTLRIGIRLAGTLELNDRVVAGQSRALVDRRWSEPRGNRGKRLGIEWRRIDSDHQMLRQQRGQRIGKSGLRSERVEIRVRDDSTKTARLGMNEL